MIDEYVLVILTVNGRYAMQLRDNRPDIDDPGLFGLFGGKIENGESPEEAIAREINEELCIQPEKICFLRKIEIDDKRLGSNRIYWLFEADVTPIWANHNLKEGQSTALFLFNELLQQPIPELIKDLIIKHHK